jgi:metallo-beta-lactamase family protein
MEITFHGAAQTVTGSQHLLRVNGKQILLDCGLYQGKRAEANYRNRHFLFDPTQLDALVLSHAHIDHSGNIPNLVKKGFRGPIYATHATVDLCDYLLRDSGRIQESDAEYLNKRAAKRGEPANVEPLYTEADAHVALQYFDDESYNKPFEVAEGVTATFFDAGHILGSASVVLDIQDAHAGRQFRLAFSGDIGRYDLPILRDPTILSDIDYVIMESTYGTKNHRPPHEALAEFGALVKATIARRGKIIIPSFAVGRAQELVYALGKMIRAGEIPPLPVYVDSPLADKASTVFWAHAGLFDDEARAFFMQQQDDDAFGFRSLKYTKSVEESKAINDQKGPLVVISASGMCESGRILHHLRNNIEDPNNIILIVSWQAPNTLGRRIADREKEVRIFGDMFKLRAQVATINGLSGHAGRDLLIQWATALQPRVKRVFLVHGEPESSTALAEALRQAGHTNVHAPALHESVEI